MSERPSPLQISRHYARAVAIRRANVLKGHATLPAAPYGNFTEPLPRTANELLIRVRRTVDDAAENGISWHAVVDAVRAQAKFFWPSLTLTERSRIIRHLRPYWDVHRFRVAPQMESIIRRRVDAGALQFVAGAIEKLSFRRGGVEVVLRLSRSDRRLARIINAIVFATGPDHRNILASQRFLAELE